MVGDHRLIQQQYLEKITVTKVDFQVYTGKYGLKYLYVSPNIIGMHRYKVVYSIEHAEEFEFKKEMHKTIEYGALKAFLLRLIAAKHGIDEDLMEIHDVEKATNNNA